ncbi:hypothetical protein LUZ60_010028 [Juncus effusus]|nr:hypothetical protein LUZ60_010028 [Juncus effusus]
MEQIKGPAIGIDLGTAYTRVCVFNGNDCKVISDDHGNGQMPSYVAFMDSRVLVGEAAKKQELQNPTNTIFDIMRLIGRRFSDPSVRNNMKLWPFKVVPYPEDTDKAGVEVIWKGEVWQFTPEEILSMILTQIKKNAETDLGSIVTDVVVAIPACFNYEQRNAVRHAGIIAGLNLIRLIGAPTAVGMFYSLRKVFARKSNTFASVLIGSMLTEEYNMVIFNLGAGTFDVSVITLRGDACQVRATAGNAQFGGKDIDKNIVEYFINSLKLEDKREITSIQEAVINLRIVSENAKISLSSGATPIPIEIASLNNDRSWENSITKAKFNELNKDFFLKCIDIMEECLKDAKMDHSMVHKVILAGGSTRIPLLQLYLRNFFKIKELNTPKHLEMAATYGASIQAFFLSGHRDPRVRTLSLLDVTPFSLGIELAHGVMYVLVPKNTSIPTKKAKTFHADNGNASKFSVEVYEGEGKMTRQNNLLGKFELRNLPYSRDGCRFYVCFQIDVNDALTVTAEEISSKQRNGIIITCDSSLEIEMSRKRAWEGLLYKEERVNGVNKASTTMISSEGDTPQWNKMKEKGLLSRISTLEKEKREKATREYYVEPKEYAIGIDFGTTYSSVGVWRKNGVMIIDNEYGNRLTHSCVAFTEAGRLIGDSVNKEQVTTNPANAIYNIKRLIGRCCSDVAVQNDTKGLPYKIIVDNDRPLISVKYKGVDKQFAPEEITSMILAKMKEIAEAALGSNIKNVVISVPACFSDSQRRAIKDAGFIAGLNVMQLINEPTAAAIAYFLQKVGDESSSEKNLLVFDLGGGILEVAIFTISGSVIKLRAIASDTNLGGEIFDDNMMNHFVEQFRKKNKKDMTNKPRSLRRLRTACEKAKRVLSVNALTMIEIDALYDGIDFRTPITKEDFEKINKGAFERCIECVEKCLEDAKKEKTRIHDVILVGGSSRIPKVQQLLQEFFDGKEICKGINQDEAIAYGASVQAAILSGNESNKKFRGLQIQDVTTLSLGLESGGGAMSVIIPKNTVIPITKEMIFTTSSDNLTEISLDIRECESTCMTDTDGLLTTFTLSAIPPELRGYPKINVTFEIDADGILNVKARTENNKEKSDDQIVVSKKTCCLTEEEIQQMVEKAVGYKAEDEEHKVRAAALNSLESCAYKLKDIARNSEVSASDKQYIEDAGNKAIFWIEDNQYATIDEINSQLKALETIKGQIPN